MSWTNLTAPNVGEATKKSLATAIIDNLAFLYDQVNALFYPNSILNGSFESQLTTPGTPDNWTVTLASGGAFALDSTDANVAEGQYSAKFTSSGTLGASIITASYFRVSPQRPIEISWSMKSTLATVTNKVEIFFYDYTTTLISSVVLYNAATGNPTSWATMRAAVIPVPNAKYALLKFTGANSAVAGSTWIDDVRMSLVRFEGSFQEQIFTANGTWTAPYNPRSGYVCARVRCWGAGAGGPDVGHTGGGGAYAEGILLIASGTAFDITIGAGGGPGGSGSPSADGGDTTFKIHSSTTLLTAGGGNGGFPGAAPPNFFYGGTATADSSVTGVLLLSGGNGGVAYPSGSCPFGGWGIIGAFPSTGAGGRKNGSAGGTGGNGLCIISPFEAP